MAENSDLTVGGGLIRGFLLVLYAAVCFAVAINANDSTYFKPVMLFLGTAALASVVFFLMLRAGSLTLSVGPLHIPAALFFLASAISVVGAVNTERSAEVLLHQLCFLLAFLVAARYGDTPSGMKTILRGMIVITALAVAYGLFQHLSPDTLLQSVVSRERSVLSTFCNAMYFGGFLVMVLPVSLSMARMAPSGSMGRILHVLLAIAIVYCIIITESRSSWIGAVAGIMMFGLMSVSSVKTRLVVIGCVAAGIVVAYFGLHDVFERRFGELIYGGSTSSFSRRIFFYEAAWNAFLNSPVIGHGIGNFAYFAPHFRSSQYWMSRSEDIVPHAHNEPLQILAETGLLGFAAFTAIIVVFAVTAIRMVRSGPEGTRIPIIGFLSSVAGVLVENLASMNLRTIPVALGLWIILGLFAGTLRPVRKVKLAGGPVLRLVSWLPLCGAIVFFAWYIPFALELYRGEQLLLEANTYHIQGNRERSVAVYREVLEISPDQPEALIYFANDILPSDPRSAREALMRLLSIHPNYPKARILLAMASFSLGDTAHAFREINRELLIGDSPDAVYYAATLAYRAGNTGLELRYLKLLFRNAAEARRYDHVPLSLGRMAQLASRLDPGADVVPLLGNLEHVFPEDPEILVPLAEVYAAMGISDRSVSAAQRASTLPDIRDPLKVRIAKLLQGGQIR